MSADNLDFTAEQEQQLTRIKSLLDDVKKQLLEKFDDYVSGITLLPPSKEGENKEKVNILVIFDDSDREKMTREELRAKLHQNVTNITSQISEDLNPTTKLVSDVWEECYDGNFDKVEQIARSAPVHDTGILQALKVSEIHKSMVLERFEKYIVTYVLAGSLVKGKHTPKSDIDVFIVIDDTDVKKMTRAELKDKLRAIISSMGAEASKAAGVKTHFNIQTYILTDFWENIKQANPVIFTFLRDGVPLYDRGIFMAWKQLLQMGRIKPSPEAIDMFMNTGSQMLTKVDKKLKEIGMEDFFWATTTTSQAALMLYGLPPPTPKETPELLRSIFVEKEGLLENEDVDAVQKVLDTRKDLEHGDINRITGSDIDTLRDLTKQFLDKAKNLFEEIQELKSEERFDRVLADLRSAAVAAVQAEGYNADDFESLHTAIQEVLVEPGIVPATTADDVEKVMSKKEAYDTGDLTKAEANESIRTASTLSRSLFEHAQRKQVRSIDQRKFRLLVGQNKGELVFMNEYAYVQVFTEDGRTGYKVSYNEDGFEELEEVEPDSVELSEALQAAPKKITPSMLSELGELLGEELALLS